MRLYEKVLTDYVIVFQILSKSVKAFQRLSCFKKSEAPYTSWVSQNNKMAKNIEALYLPNSKRPLATSLVMSKSRFEPRKWHFLEIFLLFIIGISRNTWVNRNLKLGIRWLWTGVYELYDYAMQMDWNLKMSWIKKFCATTNSSTQIPLIQNSLTMI